MKRKRTVVLYTESPLSTNFGNYELPGGLNGTVVIVADCNPKDVGFDSRVILGFFPS
jgi:hypothetical protein